MTPLEKVLAKQNEPKPCGECPKSQRVNNVLYCTVSGKIILPRFEHICLCKGERLREDWNEDNRSFNK